MTVRPFAAKDASQVAELHRLALPRGFLSTLGDRFLGSLYTLLAASDGTCVSVAADADDRCVGFVAGSLDIRQSYREVLRRGAPALIWNLMPNLVRPTVWQHILQTLVYPFRDAGGEFASGNGIDPKTIRAELLSIAISDRARGQGLGRLLVAALEQYFREWNHHGPYRVVTDAEDPRSNAFYVALGFAKAGEFRHHKHLMSLYTKELPEASAANEED